MIGSARPTAAPVGTAYRSARPVGVVGTEAGGAQQAGGAGFVERFVPASALR